MGPGQIMLIICGSLVAATFLSIFVVLIVWSCHLYKQNKKLITAAKVAQEAVDPLGTIHPKKACLPTQTVPQKNLTKLTMLTKSNLVEPRIEIAPIDNTPVSIQHTPAKMARLSEPIVATVPPSQNSVILPRNDGLKRQATVAYIAIPKYDDDPRDMPIEDIENRFNHGHMSPKAQWDQEDHDQNMETDADIIASTTPSSFTRSVTVDQIPDINASPQKIWGPPANQIHEKLAVPMETKNEQKTFGLLSYNVRCDKDAPPFSWLQRKNHVRAAVVESGAHVVCLQEAKHMYAKDLVRSLGAKWQMCGVPRNKDDEGTQIAYDTSVFTYIDSSTWVFHDEGVRRCPPSTHCTERSFFGRRRCAHVRIFTHAILVHKTTNAPINVINTHVPLEVFEQEICAHQLGEYVKDKTDTDWPVVICGDLNSHYAPSDKNTPLSILLESIPGLSCSHQLQDFPTYYEGFEHDFLPPGESNSTAKHSHRLDYVLTRIPDRFPLRVEKGGRVLHPRYYGQNGLQYRPSDHEPLLVEMTVTRVDQWM
jgi:endonuclease/exonuclease/phosphatase family metal-dependent hydrolase